MSWEWTRGGCLAELQRRLGTVSVDWWDRIWNDRASKWSVLGETLRVSVPVPQATGQALLDLYSTTAATILGVPGDRQFAYPEGKHLTAEMVDANVGPLLNGREGTQKLTRYIAEYMKVRYATSAVTASDHAGRIHQAVQETNGCVLTISANPLDILDASNFATFTSCHRWWSADSSCPDVRDYGSGTFCYVLEPRVLVAFMHRDGYPKQYKTWRCMVFASSCGNHATLSRQYGTALVEYRHALLRREVAKVLSGQDNPDWKYRTWKDKDAYGLGFSYRAGHKGVYTGDASVGIVSVGEARNKVPSFEVTIPKPRCYECGEERAVPTSTSLKCGKCGGHDASPDRWCPCCEETRTVRHPTSLVNSGWVDVEHYDDLICPACFEADYERCGRCGTSYLGADDAIHDAPMYSPSLGGVRTVRFCESCLTNLGCARCHECRVWVSREDQRFAEGRYETFCAGCVSEQIPATEPAPVIAEPVPEPLPARTPRPRRRSTSSRTRRAAATVNTVSDNPQ